MGKSTLLNAMIGEKVAITSNKAQTTRNAIRGIYTDDEYQIIFIDTPGIHKPKNRLRIISHKYGRFDARRGGCYPVPYGQQTVCRTGGPLYHGSAEKSGKNTQNSRHKSRQISSGRKNIGQFMKSTMRREFSMILSVSALFPDIIQISASKKSVLI